MTPSRPIILVHGGAGHRAITTAQAACLRQALVDGQRLLRAGASALDVVEAAVRTLEASGLFNAGLGANRQLDGVRRMDASIMEGRGLRAGAVASIEHIRHPISAARLVLEKTAHVLLVGKPATEFAMHFGMRRMPKKPRMVRRRGRRRSKTPDAKQTLLLYNQMATAGQVAKRNSGKETVGAVALDQFGTVAAGASTGGVDVMLPGRVGDSPLIGSGVYADNDGGAVSMTGLGESIIRVAAAKEIVDRLARGESPTVAARRVLLKLVTRIRGAAGALVLAPDGRFAIRHTTPHMAAGYWDGRGKPVVRDRFR